MLATATRRVPSAIDMHVTSGGFGGEIVSRVPERCVDRRAPSTRTRSREIVNDDGSRTTTGPGPGCPQVIS